MSTFLLLFLGYLAGGVSVAAAVLFGQRLRAMQPTEDDSYEKSSPFQWMEQREARDDDLRAQNAEMVQANRRQAAASNPHGLQIVRDQFDAEEANNGRTW